MRFPRIMWILLLILLMGMAGGCNNDSGNQVNIDILKQKALATNVYSFDYYRQLDNEELKGRLFYAKENIRFELYGAVADDVTVTIVNQENNKNYIYNTKYKTGEISEPALFTQDVPLPGEVMSGLNTENTVFTYQKELDGQKCTVFQATDIQFYGYKFNGEIWIANESGLPVLMEGTRGTRPVKFKYSNYSTSDIAASQFEPPGEIQFK